MDGLLTERTILAGAAELERFERATGNELDPERIDGETVSHFVARKVLEAALVSLSKNVADSDYETPLEKDSAMSASRRKGASDG